MGVALDVILGFVERLMDVSDVPGLPSTPALAADTVLGNRDPSWEEVGEAIAKDGADLLIPGFGTLGEAGAQNFKGSMKTTNERHRRMREDHKGQILDADGNPIGPGN